jgi:hypothetical protein
MNCFPIREGAVDFDDLKAGWRPHQNRGMAGIVAALILFSQFALG